MKKRKATKKVVVLKLQFVYKSETKLYKMWCGLILCVGQCWEKCHCLCINETYGRVYIKVSHIFISDISRYIVTFCGLKKRTKSSLFYCFFLSFHCLQMALDLKAEDCYKQRLRLKEL